MRNLLLPLGLLISTALQAQMGKIVAQLPTEPSPTPLPHWQAQPEEFALLTLLPDSIMYELPGYDAEYPEDPRFFPLDSSSLYTGDWNGDGQTDLAYSGLSGWNGLTDSKVILQPEAGTMADPHWLRGALLQIKALPEGGTAFTTYWVPCCDSYTSQINYYQITPEGALEHLRTVAIIGRLRLNGVPQLPETGPLSLTQPELYALPDDFRGTSPYFREKNKEYRNLLRDRKPLLMASPGLPLQGTVLHEQEYHGEMYQLVLTEAIPQNSPNVHYEWIRSPGHQLLGWIKVK